MNDSNDVGSRIRTIRGTRTQEEFAELVGVSRKTLIRYEANERDPDLDFILKMNLLFKVQPLWLLAGQLEPTSGIHLHADAAELVVAYDKCSTQDKSVIRRVAQALALSASQGDRISTAPAITKTTTKAKGKGNTVIGSISGGTQHMKPDKA